VANVSAAPTTDPSAIRQQLIEQVTGQVRWRESVEYMVSQGVELFVEAGAGKVLSVMNRRTAKEVEGLTLGTPEDVESVAERLG
jgi:[acyl-carrier-protein] S-malonyltransferase